MNELPPPPYTPVDPNLLNSLPSINNPVETISTPPSIASNSITSQELNEEQKLVLNEVLIGQHVLITGAAGTGKSFLVKSICSELDKKGKVYRILAPTGVAALNVEGQTIHRFLGLRPGVDEITDYIRMCSKRTKVPWTTISSIIIDEVSMFHPKLFELFDEICKFHKKNTRPFGGIQLILLGDFFQLSPIPNKNDGIDDPFYIFETELWNIMNISVHVLQKVMRQNEMEFVQALSDLRIGNLSEKLLSMLDKCKKNKKLPGKHYVRLFSLNIDKNYANDTELVRLKTSSKVFKAHDVGDEKYLQGCRAEKELLVKINCMVMLLWNMPEHGLCNGSVGVLKGFDVTGLPIVEFDNGVTIPVLQRTWTIKEKNLHGTRVLASRTQVPLAIAYSLSIHKSQSLTLDYVEANCKGIFTTGQLYVMLSRARSPQGLIVKNFDPTHIMVDDKVHEFYRQHM